MLTRGDDGILDNNDDAILDYPSVRLPVGLFDALLVDDLAIFTNAGVLVNDSTADGAPVADTHRQTAGNELALLECLVVVSTHDHAVLNGAVSSNQRTDANNAVLDLRSSLDDAAVADDGVADISAHDLGWRQEAGHGVDGRILVVEAEGR